MAAEPMVLWDEVNKRLPTRQDPECRQARKALFKKMLAKDKKTLTCSDVEKGMKTELRHDMAGSYVPGIKEMTKTIRFAFRLSCDLAPPVSPKSPAAKPKANSNAKIDSGVAHKKSSKKGKDKDKGNSVDKREFHGFLLALQYYLELAEFFEQMDGGHDDDQKLSCREVLKGKDKLAIWDITEDMIKERFSGVDPWVAQMKFDEFADWVMEFRMGSITLKLDDSDDEEVQFEAAALTIKKGVDLTFQDLGAESDLNQMKVQESFAKWDKDGSGGISQEEMTTVLKELDPSFTEKKGKMLFEAADVNKDGMIDFQEFLQFIFR